ncbi:MAG: threonine synthase [Firmicutes bacterium]|nr:threonine synthase [Bacillota bacterium]
MYTIVCEKCGKNYGSNMNSIYNCATCSSALTIIYDYDTFRKKFTKNKFKKCLPGIWKYWELLPIKSPTIVVSLHEGGTRLHECNHLSSILRVSRLYVKDETGNPTGSYKDRPASVAVSKAVEFGAQILAIASDGNAGPSVAAYAAKAGLPCYVFMPTSTPNERLTQVWLYGATLVTIDGSVNECIDLVEKGRQKFGWHHMSTARAVNPYQREGSKTIAYEVCEQLDWNAPDWVAVPVGGGGLLSAIWQGFNELKALGLIERVPRMLGVQAAGCAPLVRAFNTASRPDAIERWKTPSTIATTIAVPFPLDGDLALKAIYDSNGAAVAVADSEILDMTRRLAAYEGICAEPTGAVSIAGIRSVIAAGIIRPDETVVCIVTGTGLKSLSLLASLRAHREEAREFPSNVWPCPDIAESDRVKLDREVAEWVRSVTVCGSS